jgi:hypothetical protein
MSLYLHEKPGGVRNAREGQKRRAPEPCADVRGFWEGGERTLLLVLLFLVIEKKHV